MKTSMFIIGAMATAAMAQDLAGFDSLPSCGQTCVTNMVNLADSLGCKGSDVACLCMNPDFSYGLRDCTNESCSSQQDALDTQAWGFNLCANQGIAVTSVSSAISVSTLSGVTASSGAGISVTSSVTTTISTNGSVMTTVMPTVVPLVATGSTGASKVTTGVTRTSTTTTPASTQTGGDSGSNETDQPDAAPRATAVPMGIMVVAGFAALAF